MWFVLVHENTGYRYCQDGFFRGFANWGTFPECVKVYRRKGNAVAVQTRLLNKGCPVTVITLRPGDEMDASGRITRVE